ncbi:PREDICTED: uncharacterized protein LOC104809264 [Tarenaya hassleriana]|uniref:uncharacterized protein LOC104809264 n=1 Tax=Tarenaya hassleriana TaxID=28532 RepID=UPI00053C2035|nr:PREDICTED: uncharacterized protein LOC104809264 [Tarenaya hassleriana]
MRTGRERDVDVVRRTVGLAASRASRRWCRAITAEPSTMLETAKKQMRMENVEEMKKKLQSMAEKEEMAYKDLLEASEKMGIANSLDEARAFASVLDDAGSRPHFPELNLPSSRQGFRVLSRARRRHLRFRSSVVPYPVSDPFVFLFGKMINMFYRD